MSSLRIPPHLDVADMPEPVELLKAEIERLRQREGDLLEANNRYLERARKAEGALAAERAAIVALIREGTVVERDGHSEAVSFDEDELIAKILARGAMGGSNA